MRRLASDNVNIRSYCACSSSCAKVCSLEALHLAHHSFAPQLIRSRSSYSCRQVKTISWEWLKEGGAASERDIYIDKECRSRYYSHTISVRFIISPHTRLPGRISIQVTIAYSANRGESARHEFRPATISATIETESYPDSHERKLGKSLTGYPLLAVIHDTIINAVPLRYDSVRGQFPMVHHVRLLPITMRQGA